MDWQVLILLLPTLICPISMGVMMWWMHRGTGRQAAAKTTSLPRYSAEAAEELATRNQTL